MKRLLLLCTLAALLFSGATNAQISSNVFERVLNVRVSAGTDHEETATAFTVDVDGQEYLITAKHVVQSLGGNDKIDIFGNGVWTPISVKIFRCDDPIDIAVLIPPYQLTVNFTLPFEPVNIQFGQEVYFLGFPYGIQSPVHGVNGPYPLALVKRGTFSGQIPLDPAKKAVMILLDGYNNPGFSGGPIVYRDFSQPGYVMKVFGVISGFIPEVVPTMTEHSIDSPNAAGAIAKSEPWRIRRRKDGTYFEYVDSGESVALNTGLVEGYFLDPAIDLIRKHPIGPEAKDLPGNSPTGAP